MRSKLSIISRKLKEFGAILVRHGPLTAPFECTDEHHREMWAHIARHGLVMKTYKAHFGELVKTLDLDLLDFRIKAAAVGFLLKSLKEKVRSLRDQQILVCQHGVGARSVGVYPEWVQAWARPDWDGDIKKPAVSATRFPNRGDNRFPSYDHPALSDNASLDVMPQVDPTVMRARREVIQRVGDEVKGIHINRSRLSDRFEDAFSRQRAHKPRSPKQRTASRRDPNTRLCEPGAASQRLVGLSIARGEVSYQETAERRAVGQQTSFQRHTGKRCVGQPSRTSVRSDGRQRLEVTVEEAEADILLAEADVAQKQKELQDLTRKVSKWKEINQLSQKIIAAKKECDRLDGEILQAKNILAPLPHIPAQRLAEEGLGHILDHDCNMGRPTSSDTMPDEPSPGLFAVVREASDKIEAGCRAKAEELDKQLSANQRRIWADGGFASRQGVDTNPLRVRKPNTTGVAEEGEASSSSDDVQQHQLWPFLGPDFSAGTEVCQPEQKHTARDDNEILPQPYNMPVELDATCSPKAHHSLIDEPSPQVISPSSPTLPPPPPTPRPAFSRPYRPDNFSVLTVEDLEETVLASNQPRALSLYDVERRNNRFFAHLKNRMSQLEVRPSASEVQHFEALRRRVAMANVARQQLFAAACARNPRRAEGGSGSRDESGTWF
ncbi:hypothetical protein EDB81DRAFT_950942 [Dactylonectria macrodidyma]|uniref:Uncharacterized protein n=1 Tax=Dactylonectria macrodidyma TaxID=307937 RepID=A0A9P9ISB4_9HYPO|nr:hypothetical protein EDB81DRAFT_950942 [Dactylonectria macrodidyma]